MARLDADRQKKLEPIRMEYALNKLTDLGFNVARVNETEIWFMFKNEWVKLFPYSGWHTGKSIKDGRGIQKLIDQLK